MKCTAWLMSCALLLPYAATGALAAKEHPIVTKTVVVFPIDNTAAAAAPQIGDRLTAGIARDLGMQAGFQVITFSDRLPSIQRMLKLPDNGMSITGPFYTDRKAVANAIEIARTMSADEVLVGVIDKYKVSDDGAVEIGATVELVDVGSGKTVRTVVVTGRSGQAVAAVQASSSPKATPESQAVSDTAQKVASGISGVQPTQPKTAPASTVRKNSTTTWVVVGLIAIAIGLVAGHHSGGGGNAGEPGIPGVPGGLGG